VPILTAIAAVLLGESLTSRLIGHGIVCGGVASLLIAKSAPELPSTVAARR
jgi:hypothetical protein